MAAAAGGTDGGSGGGGSPQPEDTLAPDRSLAARAAYPGPLLCSALLSMLCHATHW